MKPLGVPCGSDPDRPAAESQAGSGATASTDCDAADRACRTIVEHVRSTPEDVRRTLLRIVEELSHLGVGPSDRQAIEVVLAECMNNVVEHAYAAMSEGRFELQLCLCHDRILCRVEDVGRPMPGLVLPEGVLEEISGRLEDLPEGGFGWFLIREFARDLRYSREKDRNRLSFQIRLKRQNAAADRSASD